ncbi:hypothetical protein [Psychroserpens jangbogonensis]|jgi:hypothetical protein|uniref:hypothetical protein n=1 Tax=Psychroserpens jangbogonensis TaxID=1484460 RepID=UPI00053D8D16|nr:hypothetical protein [Psychroserpens jangbogonensis]
MEYNLEQTALIVEIIGGIVIIISLLFVGLQLKESAKATRSATAVTTVSELTSWYSNLGNSEQGSYVFWNFMTNPDSITPVERFQAIMNLHGILLTWQNSYYLVKEGTLDKRVQESLLEIINGVKNNPGFQVFWQSRKAIFLKEFQEYVEEIMATDKTNSEGIYDVVDEK